jgi:hypothetical protein
MHKMKKLFIYFSFITLARAAPHTNLQHEAAWLAKEDRLAPLRVAYPGIY